MAPTLVGPTLNTILPGTRFGLTCFSTVTTSGSKVVRVLLLKWTLPEKPRISIPFFWEKTRITCLCDSIRLLEAFLGNKYDDFKNDLPTIFVKRFPSAFKRGITSALHSPQAHRDGSLWHLELVNVPLRFAALSWNVSRNSPHSKSIPDILHTQLLLF